MRDILNVFVFVWTITCSSLASAIAEPRTGFVVRDNNSSVIIFVHGYRSNGKDAWTNDNGAFWPELVAQDSRLMGHDVYVHDYYTQFSGLQASPTEISSEFDTIIKDEGLRDYDDIIFVAHSMGGIVVRDLLNHNRALASKVSLVALYASPLRGSSLANVARYLSSNPQAVAMRANNNNLYLAQQEKAWRIENSDIPLFCAYELVNTRGFRVVEKDSATFGCNRTTQALQQDHEGAVKPSNNSTDPIHRFLRVAISETQRRSDPSKSPPIESPNLKRLAATLFDRNLTMSYSVVIPREGYKDLWNTEYANEHGQSIWRFRDGRNARYIGLGLSIYFRAEDGTYAEIPDVHLGTEIGWRVEQSGIMHHPTAGQAAARTIEFNNEYASVGGEHRLDFSETKSFSISRKVKPVVERWPFYEVSLAELVGAKIVANPHVFRDFLDIPRNHLDVPAIVFTLPGGASELVCLKREVEFNAISMKSESRLIGYFSMENSLTWNKPDWFEFFHGQEEIITSNC